MFSPHTATCGYIRNASALGLNTPGVGTGNEGLPISTHQLGFVPPSGETFLARRGGDKSTGYPGKSVKFAGSHRFPAGGRLAGWSLCGNAAFQRGVRGYCYTDAVPSEWRLFRTLSQHRARRRLSRL